MVVPMWQRIDKMLASSPAVLHLIFIEFLPMWLFAYSVRSVLKFTLLMGTTEKEGLGEVAQSMQWSGLPGFADQRRRADFCLQRVVEEQIDGRRCMDLGGCIETGEVFPNSGCGPEFVIPIIVWGAYAAVSVLSAYVILQFCIRGLVRERLHSGSYLQFCLDVKRTCMYRYIVGAIALCAVFALAALIAMTWHFGLLSWFMQEAFMGVLTVAFSMKAFARPYKPLFMTDRFSELNFRRQFLRVLPVSASDCPML